MVGVAGHAVGPEGDDGVGLHVIDDVDDAIGGVELGAAAVGVAEDVVLVDAEDGQAGAQLVAAQRGEPVGGPAIRVGGAVLAGGGGDDDDPVAAAAGSAMRPAER